MKRTLGFMALASVLLLSSCMTTVKTARTAETTASIKNATVADLRVTEQRITYTMSPSKAIQRAGLGNVKQAAIQEALTQNGNADVLVEPEFVIEKERTLFGSRVNSITVTGRPAYYQNFRTLNDSVWASPGFYGQPNVVYVDKAPTSSNGGYGSYGAKRGGLAGLLGGLGGNKSKRVAGEDRWRRSGWGGQLALIGGWQDSYFESGPGFLGDGGIGGDNPYGGALLTVGYNLTPNWFVGAGTGFFWDGDEELGNVPFYAAVRYNFSGHKPNTFFIDFKIGNTWITNEGALDGRMFGSWGLGYNFGHFELGLHYIYTQVETHDEIWANGYVGEKAKWGIDHFGLSLGLSF